MKIFKTALQIVFILFLSLQSFSQCKMFAKKYCMEKLKPYMYNGQINTLKVSEGDIAELNMAFQKDQKYRIYICSQGNFEKVEFKIIDPSNNNVLFYNKDQDFTEIWDFVSKDAQQVIVKIRVPEPERKGNMVQSGCVSILVGFLDK